MQSGLVSGNYKGHNGTIRVVKFNDWVGIGAAEIASAGAGDCKPRIWDINESRTIIRRCLLLMPISIVFRDSCSGKNVATLSAHPDAVHGLFWKDRSTVVTGMLRNVCMCVNTLSQVHASLHVCRCTIYV